MAAPSVVAVAAGGESHRREQVLARVRLYLAAVSLIAIRIDPTEPARYAAVAYGMLAGYVVYALAVLLTLRWGRSLALARPAALHALDIAWAGGLSLFTDGPNSPFFVFFIFVLLEAAYRWSLRGTLLTTAVLTVVLLLEAAILAGPSWRGQRLLEGDFEFNRFIMRAMYLVIVGYLVGHLSERERQGLAETAAVADLLARVRVERGLTRSLHGIGEVTLRHFRASRFLLAVKEADTGRAYLWQMARTGEEVTPLTFGELAPLEQARYLFVDDVPAEFALHARRRDGAVRVDALITDDARPALSQALDPLPAELSGQWRSLLLMSAILGEEWQLRLVLVEAEAGGNPEEQLRTLRRIEKELAPAVENVYLLRRWRTRAAALERARVARELHDGVLQALIGLEMQVDVLRRKALARDAASTGALTHIQAHLRYEIITVRELMEQMKPVEAEPDELLAHLAVIVDKFQRETGIAGRFTSDDDRVTLSPRICRELVRIVHEALVNVRRHSGAKNVMVTLRHLPGYWLLVVDDDGHGFPFSGRLSHQQLEASRKGPVIIKERVRAIGGAITVESRPQQGSRLEITVPETPLPEAKRD